MLRFLFGKNTKNTNVDSKKPPSARAKKPTEAKIIPSTSMVGKPKYAVQAISTPATLQLPVPSNDHGGFSLFTAISPTYRTTLDYRLNEKALFVNPTSSEEALSSFFGRKDRQHLAALVINLLQANVDANRSKTLSDHDIEISPRDVCVVFEEQKIIFGKEENGGYKAFSMAEIVEMKISPEQAEAIRKGRKINLTPFNSRTVPSMSVKEYFNRFVEFVNCSTESFIIMLVLLERYVNAPRFHYVTMDLDEIPIKLPANWIHEYNIHRLVLTALMIAAKFFDYYTYKNTMWAHVGGIALKELNALEREFLAAIDYDVFVTNKEIQETCFKLIAAQDLTALKGPEDQRIDPSSLLQLSYFFLIQNVLSAKETEEEWGIVMTLLSRHLPTTVANIVLTYHDIAPEAAYIPRLFVAPKNPQPILDVGGSCSAAKVGGFVRVGF